MTTSAVSAARSRFAALPRTYANALGLLGQLSTNREVTVLFEGARAETDLNARALPEVRAWLARAGYGDLERDLGDLRCVHVAGTKGKGSVCAMVTAILVAESERDEERRSEENSKREGKKNEQEGKKNERSEERKRESEGREKGVGRVGTYLSPHVVSVRERIWLDGRPVGAELFARYIFEVWERLSEAAIAAVDQTETASAKDDPFGPATKPFYFRFLTLVALHLFVREGVRSAVVECGIGGAYDVTNVLPPAAVTAAAVTRLGIDHVAMLGHSLARIAWHKAGIFRSEAAAVTLQPPPTTTADPADARAALDVLRARARDQGVVLTELDPVRVAAWPGVAGAALPGAFQKDNMALAAVLAQYHLRAVGAYPAHPLTPIATDPAAMPPRFHAALATASLRARCEVVADRRAAADWLVDGAHTADSLVEVARFFAATTAAATPRLLLFSVRDRDAAALVTALLSAIPAPCPFRHVSLVFPPPVDAATRDAAVTAVTAANPATSTSVHPDVAAAVAALRARATALDGRVRVLATGSFVLSREVLQELEANWEE